MDTSTAPTLFAPGRGWVMLHEYQNGYPYRPGRAIYLRVRDVVLVTVGLTRTEGPHQHNPAGDTSLVVLRRGLLAEDLYPSERPDTIPVWEAPEEVMALILAQENDPSAEEYPGRGL